MTILDLIAWFIRAGWVREAATPTWAAFRDPRGCPEGVYRWAVVTQARDRGYSEEPDAPGYLYLCDYRGPDGAVQAITPRLMHFASLAELETLVATSGVASHDYRPRSRDTQPDWRAE